MTNTCYLHIGTEKTGSTSVQEFFQKNHSAIKAQGFWYSQTMGKANHRKISVYARDSDKPDDGFSAYGIKGPEEHLIFRKAIEAELTTEIREFNESGSSSFFLSNEHCHSRLLSKEMVRRVYDLLSVHFSKIVILCFLRPQVDVATSLASTAIRVGRVVRKNFFDLSPSSRYYNYQIMLDNWTSVFGKENIKVIPFKRVKDVIGILTTEFGIATDGLKTMKPTNEALDISTIAMLNAISGKSTKEQIDALRRVLEKMPARQRLRLPRQFAMEIQGRFDESNKRVCAQFSDLQADDLNPDWSKYDETGNVNLLHVPEYLHENLMAIAAKMSEKDAEILKLRKRLNDFSAQASTPTAQLNQ